MVGYAGNSKSAEGDNKVDRESRYVNLQDKGTTGQ